MRKIWIALFLCSFGWQVKAQLVLVLRNGTRVEFSDFGNCTSEIIRIKTKDGKKEFKVEEAECFYDLTYVPALPKIYNQFESLHYFLVSNGKLRMSPTKFLEGSITMYRTLVQAGNNGAQFYYSLEKDGELTDIEGHGIFYNKEKKIAILRQYLSDEPMLLKKLESEEFNYSEDVLVDMVKEYNVLKFVKSSQRNAKKSSLFFYSKMKRSTNEDLKVMVNDSLELVIPAKRMIAVQVGIDALSKICVSSPTEKDCLVVSGSPYFMRYFEVDYNQKKKRLEIKPVHSIDAQNYIRFANSQGN